jgi:peptidoglycan/xylan/chitin deacetylase (PgdA/CDA1 family)
MRIPILTYHASQISGNTYATNNTLALRADIARLTQRGFAVWPLHQVITAWLEDPARLEGQRVVALTCDDGTDHDFHDLPDPAFGMQRSVMNVLADFRAAHPADQPSLNITSFVVVSPEARVLLDKSCLAGKGWWNDDWWQDAVASGLMDIANHSWDHHHDTLPGEIEPGARRGTFRTIATAGLADYEIRQAAGYLASKSPNRGTELFAYPYGEANAYLVSEYFPRHARELGIVAAFTGNAGYLTEWSNRWSVPRFIFRRDWTSVEELDRILERAGTRD